MGQSYPASAASAAAIAALALGSLAAAQAPAPPTAAEKTGYNLFNPTPRELMREMSTDRPDTTESPYTVDAGHIQLEVSAVDFTYDRNNEEDQNVRTLAVAPVLIKLGLLNNVDIAVGLDPYTRVRATDRATDTSTTAEGFGDTVVRLKVNLWGNDAGDTAFAIMPFINFPTADDDLGNGNIEGGVILPFGMALPGEFSLGLMAEFDFIRSAADDRYVVDFVHTATVGRGIVGELAGYVEYAGFANLNGDEDYRAFFDAGVTYALSGDVQLDAGVRVGLTEAADDVGVFSGASFRY
jgi:hypothetical protein